jgi:hypothetical protein
VFDGSIVIVLATKGILPLLLCCVQNFGGAFGSCYASIRPLEVSSFPLPLCLFVVLF